MDGSWYLTRAGARPRRHPEHMIRARLGTRDWLATGYRVHDLALVHTDREDDLVGHLGPDLLGPDWDLAEAVRRLSAAPHVTIGEALLDQRNLAGIGNMYKCEALFVERVHPWTRTRDVADLERLVATAHRFLRANRDHPAQSTTGRTGRGQEHWVYGRRGEPCLRCRTPIRYAEQGTPPYQRATFWCPRCQPGHLTGSARRGRSDGDGVRGSRVRRSRRRAARAARPAGGDRHLRQRGQQDRADPRRSPSERPG